MRIDFETGTCNSDRELVDGVGKIVCVIWNTTVISEEEVLELINSGMYEYDERIVATTPRRADNLRSR